MCSCKGPHQSLAIHNATQTKPRMGNVSVESAAKTNAQILIFHSRVELERLGVRVVSGRLGRKAGEEGEEEKKGSAPMNLGPASSVDRGWGGAADGDLNGLMANRRGSMGISSMMNDGRRGSLGSIGQMVGLEGSDGLGHQSLGGGFNLGDAQRRSSGLAGLGNIAGGGLGTMGMSVNPNQ